MEIECNKYTNGENCIGCKSKLRSMGYITWENSSKCWRMKKKNWPKFSCYQQQSGTQCHSFKLIVYSQCTWKNTFCMTTSIHHTQLARRIAFTAKCAEHAKNSWTDPKTRFDIHRFSSRFSGIEIKLDLRLAKRHRWFGYLSLGTEKFSRTYQQLQNDKNRFTYFSSVCLNKTFAFAMSDSHTYNLSFSLSLFLCLQLKPHYYEVDYVTNTSGNLSYDGIRTQTPKTLFLSHSMVG